MQYYLMFKSSTQFKRTNNYNSSKVNLSLQDQYSSALILEVNVVILLYSVKQWSYHPVYRNSDYFGAAVVSILMITVVVVWN